MLFFSQAIQTTYIASEDSTFSIESEQEEIETKEEILSSAVAVEFISNIEDEELLLQPQEIKTTMTFLSRDIILEPNETPQEVTKDYVRNMQNIIYPIVAGYDEEDTDTEVYDVVSSYDDQNICNEVLNVAPIHGKLLPFECQIISIAYEPEIDSAIDATCFCHIDGGEIEKLHIEGKSTHLTYCLDKEIVEFGCQVKKCYIKINSNIISVCIVEL